MEEEEELSEGPRGGSGLVQQLKSCSGVFIASLVTGMSWVLSIHNTSLYKRLINKTVYNYAPTLVAVTSILTASFSTHLLGRKKTIIGMQLLYVVPLLLMTATDDPFVHYGCALANKFGRDMLVVLHTLYTSEVGQARLRAFFIGVYYVAFYVGVAAARFLPRTIHMTVFLSIVLDAAALGLVIMAPETPHFLVMTDRADEAERVLQLLWADAAGDEEASALLDKAELYADEYREGIFPTLTSSRFAVPLVICTGYELANYHICSLFYKPTRYAADQYNYPYMDLLFTPVFPGITLKTFLNDLFKIVGSAVYLLLCFVFPRRTLFVVSLLSSLSYGFMFVLAPLGPKVLTMVYSCLMCERFGLRQIAQTLPTEIFPTVTRDVGVSLSYLIHFTLHNQLNYMSINKPYGTREIVSIILLIGFPIGIIIVYAFMPETKDLPLTDTEELGKQFTFQPLADPDAVDEDVTDEE